MKKVFNSAKFLELKKCETECETKIKKPHDIFIYRF